MLLNVQNVRKLINQFGRRAGKGFIVALNSHVEKKVIQACECHNGSKKTLDESVAVYIGLWTEKREG